MKKMEFSVLMPVYHGDKPKTFDTAIYSVFANTIVPNDFVLVVDGLISSSLQDVIDRYVSKYSDIINVVYLPVNRGIVSALNTGLKHCKNDIVARCDADDINLDTRFSCQLEQFSDPSLVLCAGWIVEVAGDDAQLKKTPIGHDNILKYLQRRNPINHMTAMYRREIIISLGLYPEVKFREDYALWATVISKGYKVVNLPSVLVKAAGGTDMYKRRGGFRQIPHEWKLQKHLLKLNVINPFMFATNVVFRGGSLIIGSKLRQWLYEIFLREQINKKTRAELLDKTDLQGEK